LEVGHWGSGQHESSGGRSSDSRARGRPRTTESCAERRSASFEPALVSGADRSRSLEVWKHSFSGGCSASAVRALTPHARGRPRLTGSCAARQNCPFFLGRSVCPKKLERVFAAVHVGVLFGPVKGVRVDSKSGGMRVPRPAPRSEPRERGRGVERTRLTAPTWCVSLYSPRSGAVALSAPGTDKAEVSSDPCLRRAPPSRERGAPRPTRQCAAEAPASNGPAATS
jgi:hypothetical protein